MTPITFVILIAVTLAAYVGISRARRQRRRQRALSTPFPPEWEELLNAHFPPYPKLSESLRHQLEDYIRIFLAEKFFEGCGGLTLTDEIRVVIAAQACLLLLNRDAGCYPKLRSVLVYPSTYVAGTKGSFGDKGGKRSVRLGESWSSGTVVLAWDSVKGGARNFRDGHNVTMHEFAHQLDQEDGAADGAPILEERSAYSSWAKTFTREYKQLLRKTKKGKRSVLDAYGATNPAEFFAVATETFFEKPRQMEKKHPELFGALKDFYRVNPADWV